MRRHQPSTGSSSTNPTKHSPRGKSPEEPIVMQTWGKGTAAMYTQIIPSLSLLEEKPSSVKGRPVCPSTLKALVKTHCSWGKGWVPYSRRGAGFHTEPTIGRGGARPWDVDAGLNLRFNQNKRPHLTITPHL